MTILVHPCRGWLKRKKVRGWLASMICVVGAIGALLAIPLSLLAMELLVDVDPGSRWLSP